MKNKIFGIATYQEINSFETEVCLAKVDSLDTQLIMIVKVKNNEIRYEVRSKYLKDNNGRKDFKTLSTDAREYYNLIISIAQQAHAEKVTHLSNNYNKFI